MSAILWDFIKRWKWLALGMAVIQIGSVPLLFLDEPVFIIRMYFLCGFLALGFDGSSTIPRILLSFPLSRQKMSRLMWALAVPIPAAFITLCSVVGVPISRRFGVVMENPGEVILWLSVGGFGLAGSWWYGCYLLWSGSSGKPARPAVQLLRMGVALLALFTCLNTLPYRIIDGGIGDVVMLGVMALLTVLGFLEREKVMSLQASMGKQIMAMPSKSGGSAKIGRNELSGMRWLYCRMVFASCVLIAGMSVSFTVLSAVSSWGGDSEFIVRSRDVFTPSALFSEGYNPMWVIFWMMGVLPALLPVTQMRLLRTMPLTTSQIVTLIVGAPIFLTALMGIALTAAGYLLVPEVSLVSLAISACVVVVVLMAGVPISLRWGFGAGSIIGMFCVFMAGMTLPVGLVENFSLGVSLGVVGVVAVASIVFSWLISYWILARSSRPYRGTIIRIPGMPGMQADSMGR